MPRPARIGVPGALHDIMVRGTNRYAIFKDDQNKVRFLDRLSQKISEGHCFIYAWVLMGYHISPILSPSKSEFYHSDQLRRFPKELRVQSAYD